MNENDRFCDVSDNSDRQSKMDKARKAEQQRQRHAKLQLCLSDLFDHLIPANSNCSWTATPELSKTPQHAKMGFVLRYVNQLADHVLKTACANGITIQSDIDKYGGNTETKIRVNNVEKVVSIPVPLHRRVKVDIPVDDVSTQANNATAARENNSYAIQQMKEHYTHEYEVPLSFSKLYITPNKTHTRVRIQPLKRKKVLPRKFPSVASEDENVRPKANKCLFPAKKAHQLNGPFDSVLSIPQSSNAAAPDAKVPNSNTCVDTNDDDDDDLAGIEPMSDLEDSVNMLTMESLDFSSQSDVNRFLDSDQFSFLD
ncbi:uncharacterized protein LOC142351444 [Convolutriloba macropyga]|uniref:uncharacterized protein LOC142351444 n=1 Tax=Convolutriloba macropyga TaxID=536237 RepID=UPI003F51B513